MDVNVNLDGEYSGIDLVKSFIAEEKEKAKQCLKYNCTSGPIINCN